MHGNFNSVNTNVQKSSIKPIIHNVISLGTNIAKMWLSFCLWVACVRLPWYCGKIYSRHLSPQKDWVLKLIRQLVWFCFYYGLRFSEELLAKIDLILGFRHSVENSLDSNKQKCLVFVVRTEQTSKQVNCSWSSQITGFDIILISNYGSLFLICWF